MKRQESRRIKKSARPASTRRMSVADSTVRPPPVSPQVAALKQLSPARRGGSLSSAYSHTGYRRTHRVLLSETTTQTSALSMLQDSSRGRPVPLSLHRHGEKQTGEGSRRNKRRLEESCSLCVCVCVCVCVCTTQTSALSMLQDSSRGRPVPLSLHRHGEKQTGEGGCRNKRRLEESCSLCVCVCVCVCVYHPDMCTVNAARFGQRLTSAIVTTQTRRKADWRRKSQE